MDLGYVQYDNEFERSMESKKKPIDVKLSELFIADSTKLLYEHRDMCMYSPMPVAVFANQLTES